MPERMNPYQQEAVSHFTGPCRVLAGPGSGKTYVLVRRIQALITEHSVPPSQILVLTFSTAAASEMRQRFDRLTSGHFPEVTFGTFHSVFFRILKTSSARSLRLISLNEQHRLIRHLAERYFPQHTNPDDLRLLASAVSAHKTGVQHRDPAAFWSEETFRAFCRDYSAFCAQQKIIDYDDMILDCLSLLEQYQQICTFWQKRFRFVLIDEFQDISPAQYRAVRLIAASRNLFVVGDDDQSIYGFRGADGKIMQQFAADYPDAHLIQLGINYRCAQPVIRAASSVIAINRQRIFKAPAQIGSDRQKDGLVKILSFRTRREQNEYLTSQVLSMDAQHKRGTAFIFRTHAGAGSLTSSLQKAGIIGDFRCSSNALYQEIGRDLTAWFCYAAQTSEGKIQRSDFIRIMNRPQRYLLRTDIRQEIFTPSQLLSWASGSGALQNTCRHLLMQGRSLAALSPPRALRYLLDGIGYRRYIFSSHDGNDALSIRAILQEFERAADASPDTDSFLHRIHAMQTLPRGSQEYAQAGAAPDAPSIMTMHACKGLEFDTVVLPDLNEGFLPSRNAMTEEAVEEERRLFYVAMTRAVRRLFLCYVRGTPANPQRPCRFLQTLGVVPYQ